MNYWKAWTRKRTYSVTLISLFSFLYLHRHCQASSAGEFPVYIYTASATSNGSSSSDDELEISSDFEDVSVVMQWSDNAGSGEQGAGNHRRDVLKPRTNEFPESLSADASSGQTGDDNATTYRDSSSQKPLQTLQKLQQMLDETDYMTVSPKSKAGLQKPQTLPKSLYQNDSILPRKQDQQEQGQEPEQSAFQGKVSQRIDTPAQQQRQKQEQTMVEKSPHESLKKLEKNQEGINHIITSPPMSTESIRQDQPRKQHEKSHTTSSIIKKSPQMIPENLSQEKQQRRPRHPSSPLHVEPLWTSKDRSKYKKMQQMQRRAQDERRRLAQLRYLEELQHQTTSEDESTDATEGDTDDSIPSYTLPNLPIYMSDAEGEGSDSEHYYGSIAEQTSGRNPQTFEQQRQRATAVQQAASSVPPRPPYGYPPIYQPPILPNQQQQQQQYSSSSYAAYPPPPHFYNPVYNQQYSAQQQPQQVMSQYAAQWANYPRVYDQQYQQHQQQVESQKKGRQSVSPGFQEIKREANNEPLTYSDRQNVANHQQQSSAISYSDVVSV